MFSVYPLELVNENRDAFTNAYAELRRNLHFPVLGTPDDFAYSRDYFTDTPNHISSSGKQIRTARVIELLASQLGSSHGSAAAGK